MNTIDQEDKIITAIHTALTNAGFRLFKVNDGEDTETVDALPIALKIMRSVSDIVTFYYRLPATESKGETRGAVQYVAGNGRDIAHDWSGVIDSIISPVLDMVAA